jgi:hypothetical protein
MFPQLLQMIQHGRRGITDASDGITTELGDLLLDAIQRGLCGHGPVLRSVIRHPQP